MGKAKEKSTEIRDEKLIYIGPNLYDKGLITGKVFIYKPQHLIESMPGLENVLISVEEFTKNKHLINVQGSKYDFLKNEFLESLK